MKSNNININSTRSTKAPISKKPAEKSLTTELDQSPPQLTASVNAVSMVIQDLKSQISKQTQANQELEHELTITRQELAEQIRLRESLLAQICRMERTAISVEEMRAEVRQTDQERTALADKVDDLGQALTTSEERVVELGQLLDKFRAERDDVGEEAYCLEAQFSRAMKVIEELRRELTAKNQNEQKLKQRLLEAQKQLDRAVNQRESFKSELAETRNALEEIRHSILDASQQSSASS
jgi:chromosome segregation ATPase